jgi:protein-tyrosine kinase
MEKLQKALQKAREQRGPAPRSGPVTGAAHAAATPAATDTETLWEALKPFEPSTNVLEKERIVTSVAGPLGNAHDILRTKVLLAMRRNGWRRIAVTSPTMGCGKTTTACNLAIGLARNRDMRTILMEFDLRRPQVAETLSMQPDADVSDVLNGSVDFAEQALRYRDNVAISAARHTSGDPTSILLSKVTHNVLEDIEATYQPDVMIFDLPPILVSDDTRAVLKDVDCALMVAKSEFTTVSQIDACEREIAEHTNMVGVVLNQCRDLDEVYGHYGNYTE